MTFLHKKIKTNARAVNDITVLSMDHNRYNNDVTIVLNMCISITYVTMLMCSMPTHYRRDCQRIVYDR